MTVSIPAIQIQQAKAGDEQALAGVIAKLLPRIRAAADFVVCPGLEPEDAVQEGIIALFRALQTYQPGRGASFETYAQRCIVHAMEDARRKAARKKNEPLNHSLPLEQHSASGANPEEIAIRNEEYRIAMHKIHTRLSDFEKEVLLLFLEGNSYEAIAQKLSRSSKAVDNAMVRIRQKLKKGAEPL